jgi:phosphopantetheinyl transferase
MLMCLPKSYLGELKFQGLEDNFKANISFSYFSQINYYQEAVKYLHPQERKYYETLKFEKRIKSYLLGRYVAKLAVGAFTGEEKLESILIQQGILNQPIVTCPSQQNIQVSITHSDDFGAAVAFSEAYPIGIDLERISLNKTDILENQITETEKELIGQLVKTKLYSYEALLTLFWTAKEALSKVLKTGLLTPFTIYEIDKLEIKSGCIVSYFKNFAQYHNISFQLDHYMCAITCPKKTKPWIDISALKEKLGLTLTEDNIHYCILQ